ncbi:MAG: hypothetical protein AAB264_00175, partial [Planctomycetota bacterium]
GFYFLGMTIPALVKKDFFQKLGVIRYSLTMGLLLTMIATVIKMVFRLAFNVKYIIATPWINI